MQCSQCSPVSCCPPVTPATRDVLRKCQITKKLSQYVIHVHPPASQPPGPDWQNTTRRCSWEGCWSAWPAWPAVTCDSWLLLTSRLQPLLLILWENSRSECENWQHRKPPESQRARECSHIRWMKGDHMAPTYYWLLVAGEFPTWFLVFYRVVTVMTELA